jgi:hypothetical protein
MQQRAFLIMKLTYILFWGITAAVCSPANATAQSKTTGEKIYFNNPSFEDAPRSSASPQGWGSGTPGSTPDILPGAWGLDCPAQHGKTCIGLVIREDGTVEDVGQMLSAPLLKGQCYSFTVWLAHPNQYVGYNQPSRLRIWGGYSGLQKQEILDSSPLIEHNGWKQYRFQFVPQRDLKCIIFEAYFAPGVMTRYKGNILLDNCSPIEHCDGA